MRILVLNYEFPPLGGGAAPVSYEIAKRYVNRGHDVHVVTTGFGDLPREEILDGIRIYRLNCLRRRKERSNKLELISYVLAAIRFFRQSCRQQRYDVCHVHFLVPTGLVALHLKKKYGIPYIVTAHGSDVPGYNPDRFTTSHRFTPPLLRCICNGASCVTVSSRYLADLIIEGIGGCSGERLVKIPNGIDTESFQPHAKKNIILATGRLLPRKGFQQLIKAVSEVHLGFDVHICGDGPMRPQLEQLAHQSRTRIIFHGWVDASSEFYRGLLGTAAIYVLPSTQENASVSLLEAMSAGCAVITSNVSGCPETVHTSGVLINPTDTVELRESLQALTHSPRKREELQEMARQRVENVFAWERIVDEYEENLYKAAGELMAPQPHKAVTPGKPQEPQQNDATGAVSFRARQAQSDSGAGTDNHDEGSVRETKSGVA